MNDFRSPLWQVPVYRRYKVWQLEFKRFAASDAPRFQKAISSFLPWSVHQSREEGRERKTNWIWTLCRLLYGGFSVSINVAEGRLRSILLYAYSTLQPRGFGPQLCIWKYPICPLPMINGRLRERSDGSLYLSKGKKKRRETEEPNSCAIYRVYVRKGWKTNLELKDSGRVFTVDGQSEDQVARD